MNPRAAGQSIRSGIAGAIASPAAFVPTGLGFASIISCIRLLCTRFAHAAFVTEAPLWDQGPMGVIPAPAFFIAAFLSCAIMQFGNARTVRLLLGGRARMASLVVHGLALAGALLLLAEPPALEPLGHALLGASLSAALVSWGLLLVRFQRYDSLASVLLAVAATCALSLLPLSDAATDVAVMALLAASCLLLLVSGKTVIGVSNEAVEPANVSKRAREGDRAATVLRNVELNGALAPLIDTTSGSKRRILSTAVVTLTCGVCLGLTGGSFGAHEAALAGVLAVLAWAGIAMRVEVPSFKKMFAPQLLSLVMTACTIPLMGSEAGLVALGSALGFAVAYFATYVLVSEVIGTKIVCDHPTFCWIGILVLPLSIAGLNIGWRIGLPGTLECRLFAALAICAATALLAVFLLWESTVSDSGNTGISPADLERAAGPKWVRNIWGEIQLLRAASTSEAIQSAYDEIYWRFDMTKREREVFALLMDGLTVPAIAEHLFISPNTVKTHVRHIYRKLGVTSQRDLVRKCRILSDEAALSPDEPPE